MLADVNQHHQFQTFPAYKFPFRINPINSQAFPVAHIPK